MSVFDWRCAHFRVLCKITYIKCKAPPQIMPEMPERWPCCGRRKLGLEEFLSAESVNKLYWLMQHNVFPHFTSITVKYKFMKTLTLLYSNKRLTLFDTPWRQYS
jgi:hypothetical protein